jgi:hypothetical protein
MEKRFVSQKSKGVSSAGFAAGLAGSVALSCAVAAILAPSLAAAAGETFHVAPEADAGQPCTAAEPCRLGDAVGKADDGDSVSLSATPGEDEYALSFAGLTISKAITLGATPGSRATLVAEESAGVHVTSKAKPVLHDLDIVGRNGLDLESGTAERIRVDYFGLETSACKLDKGTTLRDSVCWTYEGAVEAEEEGEDVSHALEIVVGGEKQDEDVVLRNVTAVASNESGDAIHAVSAAGADLAVDAANVIATSAGGTDIAAELIPVGLSQASLDFANSSYATIAAPSDSIMRMRPPRPLGSACEPPNGIGRRREVGSTLNCSANR